MRIDRLLAIFLLFPAMLSLACNKADENTIRIGHIAEITGDMPAVGASSINAAAFAVDEVNARGGLKVGGKSYPVQLLTEDNGGRPEQAVAVAQKLLTESQIFALVGPNASRYTIPVTEVAESAKLLMIAPWSTSPKATIDARTGKPKKYVFRAGFIDSFQGRIVARFAKDNLGKNRAAVLFDIASDSNKGIAEFFRDTFLEIGGTITAYEVYSTGDRDFSAQLTKIRDSKPDIIFIPNFYSEVPLQIQQGKRLGITNIPFLGSDAWNSEQLLELCGADCEGYFFSTHYSAESITEQGTKFVSAYRERFGTPPDDVAALTYDSYGILFHAIEQANVLDRDAVRTAIAENPGYPGVTGTIRYEGTGDPTKSAVIMQIRDGAFRFYSTIQP